jgi:hypothetical protein
MPTLPARAHTCRILLAPPVHSMLMRALHRLHVLLAARPLPARVAAAPCLACHYTLCRRSCRVRVHMSCVFLCGYNHLGDNKGWN